MCKKGYYYDKEVYHKIQENLNSISQGTTYFTERELSIIKLFAMQYSAKQIADILCCSTRTVEKHKEILLEKTASFSFFYGMMKSFCINMLTPTLSLKFVFFYHLLFCNLDFIHVVQMDIV